MKRISSKLIANSLILSLGIVILFITGLISYQIWFVGADTTNIPLLNISYQSPQFQKESDVPDWRIVSNRYTNYQFLEVYNTSDIEDALGYNSSDYPAYLVGYYVSELGDKGYKKMAVVPLPSFDYLINSSTKYGKIYSYTAYSENGAYKLLKKIQQKARGSTYENQLDQAVKNYERAIAFSQSIVRCPDDHTIYFRDDDLTKIEPGDPDVAATNAFPPNQDVRSFAVSIKKGHVYEKPKSNSLALSILIAAKGETNSIGNSSCFNKISEAVINYQNQIPASAGNEALTLTALAEIESGSSADVNFSVNKTSLPISGPNFIETLQVTINDSLVCEITFSDSQSSGALRQGNCSWDADSLSGKFYWNDATGASNQKISTRSSGLKIIKLKAFSSEENTLGQAVFAQTVSLIRD
jgi:hypothetical protein